MSGRTGTRALRRQRRGTAARKRLHVCMPVARLCFGTFVSVSAIICPGLSASAPVRFADDEASDDAMPSRRVRVKEAADMDPFKYQLSPYLKTHNGIWPRSRGDQTFAA
jgi:hypothetical protein